MNQMPINPNELRDLEELASKNLKAHNLSSLLLEPPSPLQRMVIYLVALLILSAFIVLNFTSVHTLITSRAVLVSESPGVQVLAPDQFILQKILTHPGEKLQKGVLLLELGLAKQAQSRSSLVSERKQLGEELRKAKMAEKLYKDLLEGKQEFKNIQPDSLPQDALLKTLKQIHSLRSRLKEASEDRLLFHQRKPPVEYDTAIRLENRLQEIQNRVTLIESSLKGYYQDLTHQVMQMRSRRPVIVQRLATLDSQLEYLNSDGIAKIAMPITGIVSDLIKATPGTLIEKGTLLATIIPQDLRISCMAELSRQDRLWLQRGDRVEVRMDAYPSPEFGSMAGEIIELYQGEGKEGLFQAKIALSPSPAQSKMEGMNLFPGLRANIRIQGRKTSLFRILFPQSNP
jgi:multidrug resistance efflux pump